ncbi:hypothetical protein POPTR_002G064800v4 [Populus trichocarpa]|uniref:Holocarboxylase synthetase n=2 Tax=Populus TaxID=3689 RepID=B9GT77_POPTR|nr:uncharacterized protein LOC7468763 [Populus trichocarpa]KAH8515641.1 hypothetical protein H0E87_004189 [Populus deltoides]PNT48185.1 hypothetical protein POPTR_002G064800v4 [Populus trichocarpa]|eukprot:XP_002300905.2 uncharacterized protein LOC7468763 [Populus trichocarpa]
MGKKRKSIATSLEEVDRTMYASFCSAANSLSQLYTQSMNHQKLSFQAGERHGLEKLYQWIWRQQEGGSRVTTFDIINYLQNELDYCGEEPSMSPRTPHQHQNSQPIPSTNSTFLVSSGSSGLPATGQGTRSEHCDQQSKNTVFSNALSSPVRRSLQNYHIAQGGYCPPGGSLSGNGTRANEPNFLQNHNRDPNLPSSNDSSMDI